MTSNLEKEISDILNGTHTKTSGEVTVVLERAMAEIPNIEAELAAHEAAENDMTIIGSALEEAIQRATATRRHLNRVKGSVSRLTASRNALVLAERDERQKADYALLIKQRAACKSEIKELIERMPSFARLMHRVVELEKAAVRFNVRPVPGTLINPMDDMVSRHPPLPPLMPDPLLKGLRFVDAGGTVLYSHVEMPSHSTRPLSPIASVKSENFALEKELLRQAREQRPHAQAILRGLEDKAEARGISIDQAAMNEGLGPDKLAKLHEQAEGKQIDVAFSALQLAMDKYMAEHIEKPTS